ncbi:hypothetical protein G9C85_10655 [Halorubellus sp. JP-L1]|uniref:hypothetical protein n=1 Tax=Halorubellus sp. JP-L1 TaxID=2715753 RepID=UPI00140C70A5|nr:hypothetical protein [Halorubellus sp. JP-L1]NHN42085.1 hypothetical protein [Halorubellus sp. JP-L1]
MTACTYCGCDVEAHDPVVVYEREPDAVEESASVALEGDESPAGTFCNWGCVSAYARQSDVATETTCNWPPEE